MSFSVAAASGWKNLLGVLGVAALLACGCSQQVPWRYESPTESPKESSEPPVLAKSVAVPPFLDKRVNENSNLYLLYLIPLMPFGWQDFQTPEGPTMHMTSGMWMWRPNEDLAKATAEEFQAAHIFKEAFFTNRMSEGELVLQGSILATTYHGKIISYGLSVYGPLLWLIGLPATYTSGDFEISLALKDGKKVLWEKAYRREGSHLSWIYYLHSDFEYAEMLKDMLVEATEDARAALKASSR